MSRATASFPGSNLAALQEIAKLLEANTTDTQVADVPLSAIYAASGGITITASGTPFSAWPSYGAVQNLTTLEYMVYLTKTNNTLTVISTNRALGGSVATNGAIAQNMRLIEMRVTGALLNRLCVELEAVINTLRNVTPCVGNTVLVAADSFKTFSNEGAAGLITFTLPVAVAGLRFRFVVQNVNGIKIQPFNNGDIIYAVDDQTSSGSGGGYMQTANRGAVIELECIGVNEWFATQIMGSWPTFV